jgi:hypothetical protein
VGSVLEGGADEVHGRLAICHVEGRGFEEDVGAGGGEPVADARFGIRFMAFRGRGRPRHTGFRIEAIRIGGPSQAARGDSGDAEGDAVAIAEFSLAICE